MQPRAAQRKELPGGRASASYGSRLRQWRAGALRLRHADATSVGMATGTPQGVAKRSLAGGHKTMLPS